MTTVFGQMSPSIHFLVPYRSGLAYLQEALDSIVGQTRTDWVATVHDDSCDPEPVADLVGSCGDRRISVVHNTTPLGIGGNWNAGLSTVTTEFAAILHADDRLAPTYMDAVLELHARYPDAFGAFTGARIIDAHGRVKRLSAPDIAKRLLHPRLPEPCIVRGDAGLRSLLRGDFIFCPTVTYRVSRLVHPVFDEELRMSLDLLAFARTLLRGEFMVGTRGAHYLYRRHRASTTSVLNANTSRFDEELRTYRTIASEASSGGFTRSASTALRASIVRAHLIFRATESLLRGQPRTAARLARLTLR